MTVERRLAIYYTALFFSIGSIGPFVALWLDSRGANPSQTGLIVAAPSVAMVLTTVLLGSWADRLADWRTAIIACNWAMLMLVVWFFVRQNIIDIFVVWTLAGVIMMAKIPIVDAASLSLTCRMKLEFGRIRAFGSAGFIVAVILAGQLYEHVGISAFIWVLTGGAALRIAAAHLLPGFRAEPVRQVHIAVFGSALRHSGFLLTIAGSALISGSHGFFYTFGMLHWSESGIGTSDSALLWSTGIGVEVLVMWRFAAMARHLSARVCILIAGVAGVLRWCAFALEPSMLWLFLLQGLHGVTFGLLYLATVNFISRRVHDRYAAQAQALSATLSTSAIAAATLASGFLYARLGEQGYWAMAGMCAAGMLLTATSYRTNLSEMPESV
jgi:PPP family 3-phenylpropionic acid transporter